jgi:hypothetical protein
MATVIKLQNGRLLKLQNGTAALLSKGVLQAGTPVVFETSTVANTAICQMDATHAIVCFGKPSGNARCLTFSGSILSVGDITEFATGTSTFCSIAKISSTTAIVTFVDSDDSNKGKACVLTLTGTSIAAGDLTTFETGTTTNTRVCVLDSTHAIVQYARSTPSYSCQAQCLSISGTTVTANTPTTVTAIRVNGLSLCTMDATHAIAIWEVVSVGTPCKGRCLVLSDTTISLGAELTIYNGDTVTGTSICSMSSSQAICTYSVSGESVATYLTLSGDTLTAVVAQTIVTATTRVPFSSKIRENAAIVCYQDNGNSNYGTACQMLLTDTLVTETPIVFESASLNLIQTGVCALDTRRVIVTYQDAGNSNYGTACLLTLG